MNGHTPAGEGTVRNGEPLRINADDYNAAVAAGRAWRGNRYSTNPLPTGSDLPAQVRVWVTNTTGNSVPRGGCLRLPPGTNTQTTAATEYEHTTAPTLSGAVPNPSDRIVCVPLVPLAANEQGLAAVAGAAVIRLASGGTGSFAEPVNESLWRRSDDGPAAIVGVGAAIDPPSGSGTSPGVFATVLVGGIGSAFPFELAIGTAVTAVTCDAIGQLVVSKAPVFRPASANPPPYTGTFAQVTGTVTVDGEPVPGRLLTLSGASLDYQSRTKTDGTYRIGGLLINTTYSVSLAPRPGEEIQEPVEITITGGETTHVVDFEL
jgi:hypothetical protein